MVEITQPTLTVQDVTVCRYWWFSHSDRLTLLGINGTKKVVDEKRLTALIQY